MGHVNFSLKQLKNLTIFPTQEPFVDEKGFGKFHLFNLNSTKQISLEQASSTNINTNNNTNNSSTNITANNSTRISDQGGTVVDQALSRSMGKFVVSLLQVLVISLS